MNVRSDREQTVFAQNAGNQFATANVSEKMLTSVTCVLCKQRKLRCLRLQKKYAQDLQIAKLCDSHSVLVRKIRQEILRYTAFFVQKNILVKPLDYGCVRALPREDVQPGDWLFEGPTYSVFMKGY